MVITPAYTAPSAPVETIWANIKNPIARKQTKNMAELREQRAAAAAAAAAVGRCNGSGRAAFFCQRVKTYFEVGPFGRKTYF